MEYKKAVELWFENYELKTKLKPKWGQKEGKLLKDLLKLCLINLIKEEDFEGCIIWFMDQDEGFIAETKWDFGYFCSGFNKHLMDYKESVENTHKRAISEAKRVEDAQRPLLTFNQLQRRFSGQKRDIGELARAVMKYCKDLGEAVRIMHVYTHPQTRKDHALACIQNWGKEAYALEYSRQYPDNTQKNREVLKEQAEFLQKSLT